MIKGYALVDRPNPDRRHRVFKLSGAWYYMCGRCTDVHSSPVWRRTLDLLQLHAEQHKG